jgi:hypothetical protein
LARHREPEDDSATEIRDCLYLHGINLEIERQICLLDTDGIVLVGAQSRYEQIPLSIGLANKLILAVEAHIALGTDLGYRKTKDARAETVGCAVNGCDAGHLGGGAFGEFPREVSK